MCLPSLSIYPRMNVRLRMRPTLVCFGQRCLSRECQHNTSTGVGREQVMQTSASFTRSMLGCLSLPIFPYPALLGRRSDLLGRLPLSSTLQLVAQHILTSRDSVSLFTQRKPISSRRYPHVEVGMIVYFPQCIPFISRHIRGDFAMTSQRCDRSEAQH